MSEAETPFSDGDEVSGRVVSVDKSGSAVAILGGVKVGIEDAGSLSVGTQLSGEVIKDGDKIILKVSVSADVGVVVGAADKVVLSGIDEFSLSGVLRVNEAVVNLASSQEAFSGAMVGDIIPFSVEGGRAVLNGEGLEHFIGRDVSTESVRAQILAITQSVVVGIGAEGVEQIHIPLQKGLEVGGQGFSVIADLGNGVYGVRVGDVARITQSVGRVLPVGMSTSGVVSEQGNYSVVETSIPVNIVVEKTSLESVPYSIGESRGEGVVRASSIQMLLDTNVSANANEKTIFPVAGLASMPEEAMLYDLFVEAKEAVVGGRFPDGRVMLRVDGVPVIVNEAVELNAGDILRVSSVQKNDRWGLQVEGYVSSRTNEALADIGIRANADSRAAADALAASGRAVALENVLAVVNATKGAGLADAQRVEVIERLQNVGAPVVPRFVRGAADIASGQFLMHNVLERVADILSEQNILPAEQVKIRNAVAEIEGSKSASQLRGALSTNWMSLIRESQASLRMCMDRLLTQSPRMQILDTAMSALLSSQGAGNNSNEIVDVNAWATRVIEGAGNGIQEAQRVVSELANINASAVLMVSDEVGMQERESLRVLEGAGPIRHASQLLDRVSDQVMASRLDSLVQEVDTGGRSTILNIPITWGSEKTTAHLEIHTRDKNGDEKKERSGRGVVDVNVAFRLALSGLGKVESDLKVYDKNVSVQWSVKDSDVLEAVKEQEAELISTVEELGYDVSVSARVRPRKTVEKKQVQSRVVPNDGLDLKA